MSGYEKTAVFVLHQLLENIYQGNDSQILSELGDMRGWLASIDADVPELKALKDGLDKLAETALPDKRLINSLRSPAAAFSRLCLKNIKIRTFAADKSTSHIPKTGDNRIHLCLIDEASPVRDDPLRVDAIITKQELLKWAEYCYPLSGFDYDRLYLSGKLSALSGARKDTKILLAGSSYSMVGLLEDKMPGPAVNLAVNAQDPYYTFETISRAAEKCGGVDRVVISSAYYFWHTDMSDKPSDYMRSVLTRVNYPVLGKLRNFSGDIPKPLQQSHELPLLDMAFDMEGIRTSQCKEFSELLAGLPYYNQFFPRPANGMLNYNFRQQSDEINSKAAQARAKAHGNNFNERHVIENAALMREFARKLRGRQVKILLFVPPVTKYYREHSNPELRRVVYENLEPLINDGGFDFVDLFDSPDFTETDFQDYDHLNGQGAQKLSKLVAGMIG